MVTVLIGRGLIERHHDPADRRRLVIGLTEDGRKLIRRYRGKVAQVERQMLADLDEYAGGAAAPIPLACRVACRAGRPTEAPAPRQAGARRYGILFNRKPVHIDFPVTVSGPSLFLREEDPG